MSVADAEVIKAAAEFVLEDGTIAQMIFHFLASFIADQTNSAVINAIEDYIEDILDAVATYLDPSVTTNPMEVSAVTWNATTEKWETDRSLGQGTLSWPGTDTGDVLPNQMAPVLLASTGRPKTRGRKFIPGFGDQSCTGSTLITNAMTALGVALNHYIADETISTNNELIVGVPSTVTGAFEDFSTGDVNDIIGSQRRRKPGVGA